MSTQPYLDDAAVGTELPALVKEPTTRQLVMYAGASGDFYEIHYDKDFAAEQGLPGVILHGALKSAYLGQLVTDWVGAEGRVPRAADVEAGRRDASTGREGAGAGAGERPRSTASFEKNERQCPDTDSGSARYRWNSSSTYPAFGPLNNSDDGMNGDILPCGRQRWGEWKITGRPSKLYRPRVLQTYMGEGQLKRASEPRYRPRRPSPNRQRPHP